jgi:NAD(P)-dependent dehydrogenase (short-subunit alcohol dehydrogenase family)
MALSRALRATVDLTSLVSTKFTVRLARVPPLAKLAAWERPQNGPAETTATGLETGQGIMRIDGKTLVITGAASGMGRAAALAFAQRGAGRIHLADIDEAGLAETVRLVESQGLQVRSRAWRVDLADIAALQVWLKALEDDGGYDVLFNNAGVVAGGSQFPETTVERLQWIIDVNLTAVVVATQAAAQHMRARGGGVIVNTISTVALGTGFSDALYATTKSGVLMFTRCCAGLKESWNVRVAGVLPGLTNTPILKKTGHDNDYAPWMAPILANNAMCQPEDIAEAVVMLVEDDGLPGGDWVAVRHIDGKIEHQWGHDTPA